MQSRDSFIGTNSVFLSNSLNIPSLTPQTAIFDLINEK